jgi:hypothetical protein
MPQAEMDLGITIHFTGAGLLYLGFDALCQPKHVHGAHDGCLDRLKWIELVMNGDAGHARLYISSTSM